MPRTKNALVRQRVIDRCLGSPKNYSIKGLMEACNRELESIGENTVTAMNTIRDDIEQIMTNYPDANVITQRVGRNIYYSYEDKSYSIFNIPFNDDEVAQLTQTLSILARFEGMPQFEWMDDFVNRFKSSLKLTTSNEPIVGFDENIDLKGRNFFATLFSAISNKQVLEISYKNFKHDIVQKYIVHPYYLKQFNGRWFLMGHSDNIGKLSVFAFDRIVSTKSDNRDYIPNTTYNFNEYFDDMIGVTKPNEASLEIVKLWISAQRWPYVETKPLHGSQRVVSKDEYGVTIQIEVYLNRELEQLVLSFGKDIKVLSPRILQEKIYSNIMENLSNYK